MKPLKTVFLALAIIVLLGVSGAAAFIYTGRYNVAATDKHWPITYWFLDTARVRSIKAHAAAAGIVVPPGYDDPTKVVSAVAHFSAHCALCHGAPGVDRDDIAAGMYPQPPDLTDVSKRYTPAELFWILKHGIKMSAMPSMADDSDDLLWATVALLEKLSGMTPKQYNKLWLASKAQGGGNDHMDMGDMEMPGRNMSGTAPRPWGGKDPSPTARPAGAANAFPPQEKP